MGTAVGWAIWTRDINTGWRIGGHLASFPVLATHLISVQHTALLFWFLLIKKIIIYSEFCLREKKIAKRIQKGSW